MSIEHRSHPARWLPLALLACVPAVCGAQDAASAPQQAPQQTPAQPAAPDQQSLPVAPTIRKEARLVLVDAVVTDKKGNYIHDLSQNDFKVFEDNKEQPITSFSAGSGAATPQDSQKHYVVLFFDNSSTALPDQLSARAAATKFIDANASPDHLMAVVEFGGALQVKQNFTANVDLLHAAAQGVKSAFVASNADAGQTTISVPGMGGISNMEADYGARSMLLAVRTMAKNLRTIPGRKALILFSSGFPLTPERQSELTATIDACNKSNVAVYTLDVRGLVAPVPSSSLVFPQHRALAVSQRSNSASQHAYRPHFVVTAYEPQRPGGGGGGTGGGGGGSRGGTGGTGTGGTGSSGGGRGGAGGTGTTGTGGKTGTTGTTGTTGGTGRTGGGATNSTGYPNYYNNPNNPLNQPRSIVPDFPPSVTTNQQILAALAEGTGGFTIFNTNDLFGGLQKIASEQNEFYLLGYVPPESAEGSCHALKVKMNRGGVNVRARSGYCNARNPSILDGTPVEKQLEIRAQQSGGGVQPAFQAPYFYSAPNVARVNLAMEIPQDVFKFDKDKGKYHSNLNVLGIAYRDDGTVGAKFSDQVKLDLEKDQWKEFTKTPFRYENQFDAIPGNYKMTVVLSAGNESFGKSVWPLTIDPYDGKQLALGGIAMTNNAQKVDQLAASSDLDSVLLEDRTPLVVQGLQIVPTPSNKFKKSDRVIMYSEVYDALLTSDKPPRVVIGYKIQDRSSNKEVFFTGTQPIDSFLQKGSPMAPVGMLVYVKDLTPGSYRLILMAADSAGRQAGARTVDFDVTD